MATFDGLAERVRSIALAALAHIVPCFGKRPPVASPIHTGKGSAGFSRLEVGVHLSSSREQCGGSHRASTSMTDS